MKLVWTACQPTLIKDKSPLLKANVHGVTRNTLLESALDKHSRQVLLSEHLMRYTKKIG
jgi:hypothetical protein